VSTLQPVPAPRRARQYNRREATPYAPQARVGGRRVAGRRPDRGRRGTKNPAPVRGGYVGLAYFVALRSVGRFVLFPLTLSGSVVFCASCLARKASMSKKKTSVRSSSLFQTAHTSR